MLLIILSCNTSNSVQRKMHIMPNIVLSEFCRSILKVIEKNKAEGVGDVLLGRPDAHLACFEFYKLPHPVRLYLRYYS